jgi:hypothetical protein
MKIILANNLAGNKYGAIHLTGAAAAVPPRARGA